MTWLDYLTGSDWGTPVKTFLSAGLASASVTIVFTLYREHRQTKIKAGYMAMRLAVALESYVISCSEFHYRNDSREPDPDPRCDTNWDYTLPELAAYPNDAEGWQAIKPELASRSLGFRNLIQSDQRALIWNSEFTPDALEHDIIMTVTGLGIEAWEIAQSLRDEHKVPGDTAKSALDSLKRAQEQELAGIAKSKAKTGPKVR